jgi:hypothetical protein
MISDEIGPRRPAAQEIRGKLCGNQHGDQRDAQAHHLVQPQPHVFADSAVQDHESEAADQQQAAEQRPVHMQAPQRSREVTERLGLSGNEALRLSQPHRRIPGSCP